MNESLEFEHEVDAPSKKNIKIIFLLILITGALTSMFFFKKNSSGVSPFKDVEIARDILISSEWKKISVGGLLKLEREKQFLVIVLDESFEKVLLEKGIRVPSGEIINPEIKLIDKEGNEYSLVYDGSRGEKNVIYRPIIELPKNKIYEEIMLKSDIPIKANQILWTNYNAKDIR